MNPTDAMRYIVAAIRAYGEAGVRERQARTFDGYITNGFEITFVSKEPYEPYGTFSYRFDHAASTICGEIKETASEPNPIPMLLWCPKCGARHIDLGEFATKIHHTHSCQTCGLTWRPAVVPTVGVEFLPGFKTKIAPPWHAWTGADGKKFETRDGVAGIAWEDTPADHWKAYLVDEQRSIIATVRGTPADARATVDAYLKAHGWLLQDELSLPARRPTT